MSWQAIAVSATGEKHIKAEEPCQDCASFAVHSDDKVLVGAVSDGMGSAAHSEFGSHIAVEVVISQLTQVNWLSQLPDERSINHIFRSTLEVVKAELVHQSRSNGYLLQDLSCTLIAFIATPTWLFAMQVGDGLLVARSSEGKYELLLKPDKGEFANETTSVTSSEALLEVQTCMKNISYKFICAATDGVENLSLVKSDNWKPFEKFFEPLEQHMFSDKPLDMKERELASFLNSNKINQSTDDDKTLLLCAFQEYISIEKKAKRQQDDLESRDENFSREAKPTKIGEILEIGTTEAAILSRRTPIEQEINALIALIHNELNEQGYRNVTPRVKAETKLIKIYFLSDEPLIYQRSLGRAVYEAVHSLKEFRTREIAIANYVRAGVYKRNWVKKLPGFLGLFL